MKSSHPDDAGSPSPGKPSRPGQQPLPPAVVYALDCLDRGTPAQVRRHLIALGYTGAEAADAVGSALAYRDAGNASAWAPEDWAARRCMALGFLLFVFGVVAGVTRFCLQDRLTAGIDPALSVCAWAGLLTGVVVFGVGIAQMGIWRR